MRRRASVGRIVWERRAGDREGVSRGVETGCRVGGGRAVWLGRWAGGMARKVGGRYGSEGGRAVWLGRWAIPEADGWNGDPGGRYTEPMTDG